MAKKLGRPPEMEGRRQLTFQAGAPLAARIKEAARAEGISESAAIRRLLEQALRDHKAA